MSTQIGPLQTPPLIFNLLVIIVASSLSFAMIDSLFALMEWYPLPSSLFALSWNGLTSWFIWQPLTYPFLYQAGEGGITFFYLINIVLQLYLLWVMGSALVQLLGTWPFVWFCVGCGVITGLVTVLLTHATISGFWPIILSVMVAWTLFHAEEELLFFFLFPIKAKWLTAGLIGAILLVSLTQRDVATLVETISVVSCAYIWSVVAWGAQSPFQQTHAFDRWLHSLKTRWAAKGSKVVDITSGLNRQSDDEFIDAMLTKITRYGEGSLTWSERKRMQKISESKRK